MKKMLPGLIILISLIMPLRSQQLADGIAAVVGKEIVLHSEVQQYMQTYIMQNHIQVTPDSPLMNKIRKQTLDRLIEQKLLLAKAEEDTLKVDDQMLDMRLKERMQYMINQAGSQDKLEKIFGSPLKKIRKDTRKVIREQLLVEQARFKKLQQVKVSRREVEEFYHTYKDSLPPLPETVDISHILMQVKPSEKAQQEGLAKAEMILKKLKNGADFQKLAKQYSDDPASAKRGGDLGTISRGDFVPEFENAAFKLKDGEISGIVHTQFGYHIIQMIERRGEKIHTRHILIRVVPSGKDEQRVINKLKEIKAEILKGADFSEMALKYSDDKNVSKDKGHLGVFELDRLAIPQFKAVIGKLKPGQISDPFKTDFGYHIVRLNAHNKGRRLSLKKDWQQIKQFALNHKKEMVYNKWIKELKKSVPIEIRNPN